MKKIKKFDIDDIASARDDVVNDAPALEFALGFATGLAGSFLG